MLHDTKETAEIIKAGAILYREIASLKDPSPFKLALALADDIPTIVSGLHGAHLVPAELTDLSEDESTQLEAELASSFGDSDNPAVQRAVVQSAKAVLAGVLAVRAWRDVVNGSPNSANVVAFTQPAPEKEVPA
jgi:hypothetical protein